MRALLFTGGLDSTALAWMLRPEKLIFFDYGQRSAKGEERASRAVAADVGIELNVTRIDMSAFGHGTMSTSGTPLTSESKTPEFWPYRNQMLITLAAMNYASEPLTEIMVGTVAGDEAHPDGSREFVAAVGNLVCLQSGVIVSAPAIAMTTLQLIRTAGVPKAVLGWTFSCHTGEWACGSCRGCNKHRQVIECLETGIDG
jgi:7-cyano-7-deazaguanine synthase